MRLPPRGAWGDILLDGCAFLLAMAALGALLIGGYAAFAPLETIAWLETTAWVIDSTG